jgi:hypothetical protein
MLFGNLYLEIFPFYRLHTRMPRTETHNTTQMTSSCAKKWSRKRTKQEKRENRHRRVMARMFSDPTRDDFKSPADVLTYCRWRGLSKQTTDRVLGLLDGTVTNIDWRDQRSLPPSERVPRGLECPPSPPRYWQIDYFPPVRSS